MDTERAGMKPSKHMDKIFERRTVRNFIDKEVKIEDIKEILFVAMQAPSAKKQIPWEYVIVDKKQIPTLMKASNGAKALKEANKVVIFVANKGLDCPEFIEQDMAASLTYFMLEARKRSIGSVWIGIYPHEDRVSFLDNYLKIEKPYTTFAMVGIGYPSKDDAFKILEERFDESRIHIGKW